MIWLTWRQFRAGAAMMLAAIAVVAAVLGLTGPGLADDYSTGSRSAPTTAAAARTSPGSSSTSAYDHLPL
jgi:hypothetical protein